MTVSIVHTNAGTSSTSNPTSRLNGVVANDTLFALIAESDANFPGVPSDNQGDVWNPINNIQLSQGVAATMAFCLRAKGGNTTVTMPTGAGSAFFLCELANVMSPVPVQGTHNGTAYTYYDPNVPDDMCVSSFAATQTASCDLASNGPNGSLALALICGKQVDPSTGAVVSGGSVTFTPDGTPWSALGTPGQFAGMNYAAYTLQLAAGQQISPSWRLSVPATGCVVMCSFPSA